MTILRGAMTTWYLVDITPLRTSQEAEEMKEKQKRKAQIMFLVPSVKFRCPMLTFRVFEYLIHFWSYPAHDYIVMKPRTWPTWWSSSDENQPSSHRDIQLTIQTFILLVTMEPASLLACYFTIAADHNYTLLEGQLLSHLPDASWYIPSLPAPPIPSVSCLSFSLVISGLSSGLKGCIQLSLCPLSPLPMVLVSHTPVKSSFPSHSWCFLDCNESSICILLIYLQMISTNVSVLISSPWSTDRKKNPLSSFPRREPIKGARFPLSAALRTLALCFSEPKV